ncbi:5'-3' exonuclease H3TH domain-containing protein [Sporosarcina aquimarina]|uniref:5'-3' exonuclease n=2 Tax=Sporosarcina aquimarina TaxID=114975 RepID=A0ABU4G1Z9_9BACL|nr:5'-3' exonuclease H3TH domain-containing protein [Sporosarcina aquimarina]MDW0111000.1 5'-3' exonuclease H3TH domain-containing protein [Sporosarcina aquimarina]
MTNERPHILIVDGMALLFRSFFATAVRKQYQLNEQGIPTNGVQGFVRHTLTAISLFKPTHLAVCWDMGAVTFRNDIYDGYKANRPAPAPELVPQFDLARSVSEDMNWKNYGVEGMEADDLIGSLVKTWKDKADITIVSGDKDLLQLLAPSVQIALTKKGHSIYDVYSEQRFVEEYGMTPVQFIDYKAFIGDPSDGYPGVKGIGPKTALKLIQTYGTAEGVVHAVDELTKSEKAKIEADLPMLQLSKDLATIHCEVDLGDTLQDLEIPQYDENTKERLRENGLNAVLKQLISTEFVTSTGGIGYERTIDPFK